MEKIAITKFQDYVAITILNLQDKLNPHKDGFIDESEIQGVLDFFGETDIKKLLKSTESEENSSVFDGENNNNETNPGLDSFEGSSVILTEDSGAMNENGTATNELMNRVMGDLSISSVETPFSGLYKSLIEQKKGLEALGKDTSAIETEIENLKDSVREYIQTHKSEVYETLNKNGAIQEFRYGTNKEKVGYVIQSVQLKGNDAIHDKNNENNSSTENNGNNREFDGGIVYSLEVKTKDLHGKFNVDAASDNTDLHGAIAWDKTLKNGGIITVSADLRETVEKNNNSGSGGIAFDYSKNKFKTGIFGYYSHETTENYDDSETSQDKGTENISDSETDENPTTPQEPQKETSFNYIAEAYAKYGSFRGAIGADIDADSGSYYYSKLRLDGKREFKNSDLKLTGGIDSEYGFIRTNDGEYGKISSDHFEVGARGGISFKAGDMSAGMNGNVRYNLTGISIPSLNIKGKSREYAGSILANFQKGKFGITTMLSAMKSMYKVNNLEENNTVKVASSVTITIKDLYPGISPTVNYSVDNSNGAKHNVGFGLLMSIGALSENKKR